MSASRRSTSRRPRSMSGAPRTERQVSMACRATSCGSIRALLREQPNSAFLFLSERKTPLSVDAVQKLVERLGQAAGFAFPIHVHMLRHSAGYALAGRGVDTRTLQSFMGHRSISNTVIYTAVADKRVRNIWRT